MYRDDGKGIGEMEMIESVLSTIRAMKDAVNPEKCEFSVFSYEYTGSKYGFRILEYMSRMNDSMVVGGSERRVIMADVKNRRLLRVEDVDLSKVEHNEIVDMSVDGDRWEGDVLNGEPCGWGVLYNRDNIRVYEGFCIGNKNECYGRSYYSDIGVIEYEGEWCDGKRWGHGVQYDRTGGVVYDGEWLNGDRLTTTVTITPEMGVFHNHIEELFVSDGSCNGEEMRLLDLSLMSSLKSVRVGSECFSYVEEVKLIGLNELESVVIGMNSFTKKKNSYRYDPNRHFYLKNCPKLKSLKMGRYSFSDYSVCAIENVDALEVIQIGDSSIDSNNFRYASLVLKSILIHNE